ncbi:MAG: putative Ig domain-containing protein, partial [Bacteroidales bacterium]
IDPDDEVTLSAPELPSWMTFNPVTGVLSGTPTNEQVQFADDSTFNITLAATDLADETVTQEFTLTVVNVNDLPEVLSQSDVQTDRNQPVTISINDLVVNDPDNVFPTDHTMTILPGDNYTASGTTITPEDNYYGELLVNVQISDLEGSTDYQFVITVNFVNIAPEFTSTPKTNASEGSPYSYLIQVEDPDADQTITITTLVLPAWLEFDDETNLLVGVPQRSDVGDNAVSLKVSDGELETFQNFTIAVKSTNNVPVIISSPPLQVNNYAQYTYIMNATDADAADVLTYSAQLLPAWLSFDPATRTLSGIPEKTHVGTHNVILKVTDGYDEVLHEFTITVLDVNTAPVVISEPVDSARINKQYTYLMEVVDYEGDNLTFTPTLVPTWLTFDAGSRVLSGTPAQADLGEHTVIITVTDGAFTVNHQFIIRVVPEWPISVPDFGAFSGKMYPNPSSDFVIFEMRNENSCQLEITDITGKIVVSKKVEANTDKVQIDLSEVEDGVYIYRMFDGKQQQTGRLVVNKK